MINIQKAMKIHLIAAARPNFMKIAPLFHQLKLHKKFETKIIHTGQHYDKEMFSDIFDDLNLPEPHFSLNIGSGTHSYQVAMVMIEYEKLCENDKPDLVIVVGDVNATMACSIVAKKLHIKVAHLEAGLRSFDKTMPEEINRMVTDSIVDYYWTPSLDANENLIKAGIDEKYIFFVGNIMIDSLEMMREKIDKETIIKDLNLPSKYVVATFHRPSNVDSIAKLQEIVNQLIMTAKLITVVFPIHPRTRKRLLAFDLLQKVENENNIITTAPLSYKQFMRLVFKSKVVVTDSGGIQEETTYLGIPCLTVRKNTERPITITQGTNELIDAKDIGPQVVSSLARRKFKYKVPELWDGKTAQRIAENLPIN